MYAYPLHLTRKHKSIPEIQVGAPDAFHMPARLSATLHAASLQWVYNATNNSMQWFPKPDHFHTCQDILDHDTFHDSKAIKFYPRKGWHLMLCSHKSLPSPTVITGLDTQETQANTETLWQSSEDWQRKFFKLSGDLFLSLQVASIPSQVETSSTTQSSQRANVEYHSADLIPDDLGK